MGSDERIPPVAATTARPTAAPTFDEQVQRLIDLAAVDPAFAAEHLEPLRDAASSAQASDDEHLPALIVVAGEVIAAEDALPLVVAKGKPGRVDMTPVAPVDFAPIVDVVPPAAPAYLLLDVDLGARFRSVRPEDALVTLRAEGRTPLTIEEGVSLLLQLPDALLNRTAFSLLASRRADQRVPALWTSYGAPRLGWCWDRNPHTWLGSASAASRVGPTG
jgi:hypothetical protein